MDKFLCYLCTDDKFQVLWVLCLISMHHPMMLLLLLQCYFLFIWWEKSVDCWLIQFVLFRLYSPLRSSFASVVFDFIASLNDVAPNPPMSFPVELTRSEKQVKCLWISFLCYFFVFTPHIEFNECCVWFQCITQWCCSCLQWN